MAENNKTDTSTTQQVQENVKEVEVVEKKDQKSSEEKTIVAEEIIEQVAQKAAEKTAYNMREEINEMLDRLFHGQKERKGKNVEPSIPASMTGDKDEKKLMDKISERVQENMERKQREASQSKIEAAASKTIEIFDNVMDKRYYNT